MAMQVAKPPQPRMIRIHSTTSPAAMIIPTPVAVQRTPDPIVPTSETTPAISSGFGTRQHPVSGGRRMHHGVDIPVPVGTIVRAPEWSKVRRITRSDTGGLCLTLSHSGEGRTTTFCHLLTLQVSKGDFVGEGRPVAFSGQSGRVTGPHLHLEHTEEGARVDPSYLIAKVLRKGPR